MGHAPVSRAGCQQLCSCDDRGDDRGEECFQREADKASFVPLVVTPGDENEVVPGMQFPWVQKDGHLGHSHAGVNGSGRSMPSSPETALQAAPADSGAAAEDGQHGAKVHSTPPIAVGDAVAAAAAKAASLNPATVRRLIQGQHVELLSTGGGTVRCVAFLDRRLAGLTLKRIWQNKADGRRTVRIEDIVQVMVGESGGQDFGLRTEDLSVTLALTNQQAVAFTFSDLWERDDFAQCVASLVGYATTVCRTESTTVCRTESKAAAVIAGAAAV